MEETVLKTNSVKEEKRKAIQETTNSNKKN